jgi:hypothetical protein
MGVTVSGRFVAMPAAGAAHLDPVPAQIRTTRRLADHDHADQRDQPVAREAHAGDLGRRPAESLTEHEIGQQQHDQRRYHVEYGDLQTHQQPAADPCLARKEIRHDDQLAVTRAERMDHAVEKGETGPDQEGQ